VEFRPAPADQVIQVADERALRAALSSGGLGWSDQRIVQLTADIQLTAPLLISAPLRIQGNCGAAGGRCTLRGSGDAATASAMPLLHVSGPSALVELANLELTGGVGEGSLAGALTASNHSVVQLLGVQVAGNRAAAGGGLRADTHATLALLGCEVIDNMAQVKGL
jgi:hypothetical protein